MDTKQHADAEIRSIDNRNLSIKVIASFYSMENT